MTKERLIPYEPIDPADIAAITARAHKERAEAVRDFLKAAFARIRGHHLPPASKVAVHGPARF